jgi:putative drug exporter of the RND superfamily
MNENQEPSSRNYDSGIQARLAGLPAGRRSKWLIVVLWIAILAFVSPYAAQLGDVETNDGSGFLPSNAESVEVNELLEQFENGDTVPAVLVYEREGGLTESDLESIEEDRQRLAEAFSEDAVGDINQSESGEAAIFNLEVSGDFDQIEEQIPEVRDIVQGADGLGAYVSGQAGFSYDAIQVFGGINVTLLIASAIVVTILLLVIYRSPFVWIVPLLVVGFANQTASGIIYGMVTQLGLTATGQNNGILAILIFGVGTDYALLLIARYREELRNYADDHVAMAQALRRAGPAVLASGGTTIIGLLCLLLADLNSTSGLGPIGTAGIFSAFVAMLTLLPAIMVIVGRRIFWPFVPVYVEVIDESRESIWDRIGRAVSHRPRPVWAGATVVLLVMVAGMLSLGDDLTQEESFRGNPESLQGQQVLARHFTAGSSNPTIIVANASEAEDVQAVAQNTEGVDQVFPNAQSGELASFGAILAAEPESDEAFRTIERLRDNLDEVSGANALVGGPDATELDTAAANSRDRLVVTPAVLGVVFVILVILLRGLIAPLLMVGTTIVSFHAALGVVALFFTQVLGYSGISDYVILLSFVFLITLGIDYNIFLMSRIREETLEHDTTTAAKRGLTATGGVITSAGVVLGATFLVVGVLPLIELLQLGIIVAFGVLLETTIVRSVVLPAMVMDLGDRVWWPGKSLREADSRTTSPQPEGHLG